MTKCSAPGFYSWGVGVDTKQTRYTSRSKKERNAENTRNKHKQNNNTIDRRKGINELETGAWERTNDELDRKESRSIAKQQIRAQGGDDNSHQIENSPAKKDVAGKLHDAAQSELSLKEAGRTWRIMNGCFRAGAELAMITKMIPRQTKHDLILVLNNQSKRELPDFGAASGGRADAVVTNAGTTRWRGGRRPTRKLRAYVCCACGDRVALGRTRCVASGGEWGRVGVAHGVGWAMFRPYCACVVPSGALRVDVHWCCTRARTRAPCASKAERKHCLAEAYFLAARHGVGRSSHLTCLETQISFVIRNICWVARGIATLSGIKCSPTD